MEAVLEKPPLFLSEYGIEFFIMSNKNVGFTAQKHMHPAVEFIYVKDGQFEIVAEQQNISAFPGDMVLFRSNTVHSLKKVSEGIGEYYVLKLSPTFLFSMFQKSSIGHILPFLNSCSEANCFYPSDCQPEAIRSLWASMIKEFDANEPSFFAMQRLLACEFILSCARHLKIETSEFSYNAVGLNEPNFRLISESINYINENFASSLTAAGCAAKANLSYSHYAKLFHAVIGRSFKEYLTDLRMVNAYNMLLSSSMSVSDVAIACGYEHFSHFIAEFKKKYGATPGQFRKNIEYSEI